MQKSKLSLIALALLATTSHAINLNEATEKNQAAPAKTSSVSELLQQEANQLQQTINDKVYARVSGLPDGEKSWDKSLLSLVDSKQAVQEQKNATSEPLTVNVTSSSYQSSSFQNGTLKSSNSTSTICFNGKCKEKICQGEKCHIKNTTNEEQFNQTFNKIEKHVELKEQQFENDVTEHTLKVVDELQKDQHKMHEWIGQLQPKLLQVPTAKQVMSKTDETSIAQVSTTAMPDKVVKKEDDVDKVLEKVDKKQKEKDEEEDSADEDDGEEEEDASESSAKKESVEEKSAKKEVIPEKAAEPKTEDEPKTAEPKAEEPKVAEPKAKDVPIAEDDGPEDQIPIDAATGKPVVGVTSTKTMVKCENGECHEIKEVCTNGKCKVEKSEFEKGETPMDMSGEGMGPFDNPPEVSDAMQVYNARKPVVEMVSTKGMVECKNGECHEVHQNCKNGQCQFSRSEYEQEGANERNALSTEDKDQRIAEQQNLEDSNAVRVNAQKPVVEMVSTEGMMECKNGECHQVRQNCKNGQCKLFKDAFEQEQTYEINGHNEEANLEAAKRIAASNPFDKNVAMQMRAMKPVVDMASGSGMVQCRNGECHEVHQTCKNGRCQRKHGRYLQMRKPNRFSQMPVMGLDYM